jgi:hypothetical protein
MPHTHVETSQYPDLPFVFFYFESTLPGFRRPYRPRVTTAAHEHVEVERFEKVYAAWSTTS